MGKGEIFINNSSSAATTKSAYLIECLAASNPVEGSLVIAMPHSFAKLTARGWKLESISVSVPAEKVSTSGKMEDVMEAANGDLI
jgi:hypothetical protein